MRSANFSLSALAAPGADCVSPAADAPASRPWSLRDLLRGVADVAAAGDVTVTGLCLDSRAARPGDLFFALPGGAHDGRDFIAEAVQRGASAVAMESPLRHPRSGPPRHPRSVLSGGGDARARLTECGRGSEGDRGRGSDGDSGRGSEGDSGGGSDGGGDATVPCIDIADLAHRIGRIASRFYGEPSARMRVIGITGTNGKTTCAYLTAQALSGGGEKCALLSTVGGGIVPSRHPRSVLSGGGDGGDAALQPAALTTADAIATQRRLADFLARGAQAVCVEASSHGLAQGRVGGVDFDLALFTNLSRDHLDYHGDMDDYRAAKRRLFEGHGLRCAVINLDDDFGRELLTRHRAADCLTYAACDAAADLCARDIESTVAGLAFEVDFRGEMASVRAPLLGMVNAPNMLAAIAAGLSLGHDLGALAAAARGWRGPPGRMELLPRVDGRPAVVIDYAHTPDALARALDSLAELCAGRLHLVFGCGGDRDAGKRPLMGQVAARAGRVILTDDNPRTEDPAQIAADIAAGMESPAEIIHSRRAAIDAAIAGAGADDIVLVAGKGCESTQTVGDCAVEFSDRAVATAVLEALR